MTHRNLSTAVDHALGILGLFLVVIVSRLAEWDSGRDTAKARLGGFFARRAIAGVAAIGWIVDWLPLPDYIGDKSYIGN